MHNQHDNVRDGGQHRLIRAAQAVLLTGALALAAVVGIPTESASAQGTEPPQWHHSSVSNIRINENRTWSIGHFLKVEPSSEDHRYVSFSVIGADGWRVQTYRNRGRYVDGHLSYNGAGLDHEAYPNGRLVLTVRAHDWNLYSDRTVTVRIIDVAEAPGTPGAPSIQPKNSGSVYVRWDEPENTGPPMSYRLRYRHHEDEAWQTKEGSNRPRASLHRLAGGKPVIVSVQAYSDEGTSEWSPETRLEPLQFEQDPYQFQFPENQAGILTLGAVRALRGNENTGATYELGDDADGRFRLDEDEDGDWQLRYVGEGENYEALQFGDRASADFRLQLRASEPPHKRGNGKPAGTARAAVVVSVTDLPETPAGASLVPVARQIQQNQADLQWHEPPATERGEEPITKYRVCLQTAATASQDDCANGEVTLYGATAHQNAQTISGLVPETRYRFRVAAQNRFGWGSWSPGVEFTTEKPNRPPTVDQGVADLTITLVATYDEPGPKTVYVGLVNAFEDPDEESSAELSVLSAESSDDSVATVGYTKGSPLSSNSLQVTAKSAGTADVTVTVADEGGLTVSDTFTVTVENP